MGGDDALPVPKKENWGKGKMAWALRIKNGRSNLSLICAHTDETFHW